MRFPCETIVKNYLTAYRRGLIKQLSRDGWTQQKIAESLNITQAAVSEHMKKDHRKYGDDAFNLIVHGAIDASLPRLERDVAQVTDVMSVVCTACKAARMPSKKFCTMHMNEIPALASEPCKICSKYVDAPLLTQGSEEQEIINALIEGYKKIRHDQKFINIIPEVQSNLVLGFKSETKNGINDYAGFPGRIIKTEGEARVVDSPAFGAS
nr:thiamine-phosphate synthase family protein [Candidatus Sigynarchaeota archaeon]